jgi:oligopeptide transport system substrate-binding protein
VGKIGSKFKFLSSLALVGFFAVTACTKKGGGGQLDYGLDVKDTIRINLQQEPPTLDWNKATDTTSNLVLIQIHDGLVGYDLTTPDYKLVPLLASEFKPSQGAKVWTFKIREGVKWSDGKDFTAQQVVDGFERLLAPATASEYAYAMFVIKGAKDFNSGKTKDFKDVGVKVNDKGEVVVELVRPMGYFPMLLTHASTNPVRKDLIEKFGDKWTDPANIATIGPYKLKAWDHDKAIVLERNDAYWGEKAKTKNIIGYMINEYSTALNLVESDKLDFQETIPFNLIPRYKDNPGFHPVVSLSIS